MFNEMLFTCVLLFCLDFVSLEDSAVCMQSESDDQPPVVDKLARFTVIWISRTGGRQCYLTSWPDA